MTPTHDDLISDLLLDWEARRAAGEVATAEMLCRDHPDLVEEVRERIRALESIYGVPNRIMTEEETGPPLPSGIEGDRPPIRVGPCEILSTLGYGGMGVVYRARQVALKRIVALKMIVAGPHASPRDLSRFRTEVEAVARLDHENIVRIFHLGEHEGRPYYVMEYVEGGSLERRLDGRPRPPEPAVRLVETLARATHYAHERGVVHRDLKPANILIDAEGHPKIGDFGLAKFRDADGQPDSTTERTETGAILGTPSYMAPEQAAGQVRAIGPATDIHALGVLLYELLTGRTPYRGESPLETLEQVRFLEPVPPRFLRPSLARDLEVIVLKCLEKDPARRYATAEALADDLRRFLDGEPITARGSSVLDHLVMALDRSHHDREFRAWGNAVLKLAPIMAAPHVLMFAVAWWAPGWLIHAMLIPWTVMLLVIIAVFWLRSSRFHMPSSPAVRQFGSLLIGHWIAASLLLVLCRWMFPSTRLADFFSPYPFVSILAGQLFFNMGSGYWGRCYLAGLAFFLTALVMPLNLALAPLVFAAVAFTTFVAIGLHLRRLGREDPESYLATDAPVR